MLTLRADIGAVEKAARDILRWARHHELHKWGGDINERMPALDPDHAHMLKIPFTKADVGKTSAILAMARFVERCLLGEKPGEILFPELWT